MRSRSRFVALLSVVMSVIGACNGDNLDANPDRARDPETQEEAGVTEPSGFPFEPVGPTVYVPKVKNLLTGLAATDAEVKVVEADPNALRGLIDTWMTLPSFKTRILDFLRNAFQQNQVTLDALKLSYATDFLVNNEYGSRLARNVMDSFGLTVWRLHEDGKPFTTAFTTRRYMMTTAMLSLLSYLDDNRVDDARRLENRLSLRSAVASYTLDSASNNTVDDALDPSKPAFMTFKFTGTPPEDCATTSVTFPSTERLFYRNLFMLVFGRATFNPCGNVVNPPIQTIAPLLRDADFDDWRMVEISVDRGAASASPAFYELAQLRRRTDVTLRTERLGFYGTLAFQANWGTNATNEARVTANQALIVGIGKSVSGSSDTPFPVDATDADHAANPACVACHNQLDPYKQFFRQSWSLYYNEQSDPLVRNSSAGFAFEGVTKAGKGIEELAQILAAHPRVPVAWVSKLQFWANSTPAIESDPEVLRIAKAFADSNFDLKTLVRETFSSPLVTWASETQTTKTNGVIVSIARRDQFCASLSNRLGIDDLCGMLSTSPTTTQRQVAQPALLLPVDGYYRSFALSSLPTHPDLFFRTSAEAICRLSADQVIDVANGDSSKYVSADAPSAIADFVTNVMALGPSDPRYERAKAILSDNFDQSKASGATATDSLKATFVLACLSPTSVVVGL